MIRQILQQKKKNSVADLAAQRDDLRLLVAGEFYDKPEFYYDIIEKLGIGDKVKVINQYIPNEELAKYFQLSEVVVLPYRSGTQSGIFLISIILLPECVIILNWQSRSTLQRISKNESLLMVLKKSRVYLKKF